MTTLNTTKTSRPKTAELHQRFCEVLSGGVNSPVRSCNDVGQLPLIVEAGAADCIWDVDGNRYIDYCVSWGALAHGHAHPVIIQAIAKQASLGTSYGICCPLEERLARKVLQWMPNIEQLRFVSSGTEATMTAARIARGYTKRNRIIKFAGNYHGHADFFLVQAGSGVMGLSPTSSSAGIPDDVVRNTICLPFNDIEACRKLLRDPEQSKDIAAVFIEPIAANMGVVPATKAFLQMLREETQRIGALLIFDEVISGFRVGLGGAQALYGIAPDLTCLGKIVGGGLPAAAFGGSKEIMSILAPQGPVYQAGTLSGNPLAMAAGYETIRLLEVDGVYEELERKANVICDGLREAIKRKGANACVQQVGSAFTLFFGRTSVSNSVEAKQCDTATYARLFAHLLNDGIYIPPSQFEAWLYRPCMTKRI